IPNVQKSIPIKVIPKTDGNVSVAVTNGATICPIKPWTSIPNHIVIVAKSNKTIAVGINASNQRATDGGTCSGMVIRIPLTILQQYLTTAIIAEIIPTNIPPAPRFSIGNRTPSGTVSSNSDNGGEFSARVNPCSPASGPVIGTIVN